MHVSQDHMSGDAILDDDQPWKKPTAHKKMKSNYSARNSCKKIRKISRSQAKEEQRRMLDDDKGVPLSDWADLPFDVVLLIYKKLYDTFDYTSFRAVCKWWRAAAPLSEHPPQLPFFLERESLLSSEFKLYSLHNGQTRTIHVPEAFMKEFSGQSHGYLITYNSNAGDTPALLNPFTRAELPLPFNSSNYFRPLHVGANPIQNSNEDMVIYMRSLDGYQYVGFRKNDDNEWALKAIIPYCVEAYHRGRLFFNNSRNYSTTIIDLVSGNQLDVRIPPNRIRGDFSCLGEGASGAMLGIQRRFCSRHKYDFVPLKNCWFEVYRLDEEHKPPRWVKLSNIGDLMIFLNSDNSGFCLSASDFQGIKGNCIYFTRWNGERGHDRGTLIGRNELGNLSSEEIGQVGSEGIWYLSAPLLKHPLLMRMSPRAAARFMLRRVHFWRLYIKFVCGAGISS
ncbi:F-box protein [Carex littledalei]|uniref:F-box protein n=1 Tax=Carex littledalei TaxID=544730 RepID=A0A833RIP5_9POAL|nr:F-box protein [Carex littledalei]